MEVLLQVVLLGSGSLKYSYQKEALVDLEVCVCNITLHTAIKRKSSMLDFSVIINNLPLATISLHLF